MTEPAMLADKPAQQKTAGPVLNYTLKKSKELLSKEKGEKEKKAFWRGFQEELQKIADIGEFVRTPAGAALAGAGVGAVFGAGAGALSAEKREDRIRRALIGGGIGAAAGGGLGLGAQQLLGQKAKGNLFEVPDKPTILDPSTLGKKTILDMTPEELEAYAGSAGGPFDPNYVPLPVDKW
jgi:hypothetical protein